MMFVIIGTPEDENLTGSLHAEVIYANAGHDSVDGAGGDDILYGNENSDTLVGNVGNNIIYGNQGSDRLLGDLGNDILFGGIGDDTLDGGTENDNLFGDQGNDWLQTFTGADTLTGGEGDDRFAIAPTTGGNTLLDAAVVTDFIAGNNQIVLTAGLRFEQLNIFQGVGDYSNDVIVQDTTTNRYLLVLKNVNLTRVPREVFLPSEELPPPTPGILALSAASFTGSEDTPLAVVVTRTGGSQGTLNAVITLTDGSATAPSDYDNTSLTVTFAEGETTPQTLFIPIGDDSLIEGDETFNLNLTGAMVGGLTSAVVTIQDNDFNQAPTDILLSNNSIPEQSAAGALVGVLSTVDPDQGDSHTYTLLDQAQGQFVLNGDRLEVAPGAVLDYETTPQYTLQIQSTDAAGLSVQREFVIPLTNVNEAPTHLTLSNATLPENAPADTEIGTFSATDPDVGDTQTYSLLNDAGGRFTLVDNRLQVAPGAVLDYETTPQYTIQVQSTDAAGLSVEQEFVISLTDVNETITGVTLSNAMLNENAPAGTEIGTFSATDPNAGSLSYSLLNNAGGRFTLVDNRLQVAPGAVLDYETTPTLEIEVQVSNTSGLTLQQTLTLQLQDQNDAPVLDNSGVFRLAPINQNLAVSFNQGTLVSEIIASAGGDRITDEDTGAQEGIAVTALDSGNGTWEYSVDGSNWIGFGSVSDTSATLLSEDARIRFLPNFDFTGTPALTFRAWDQSDHQSSGATGVNVSSTSAETAFSSATASTRISVVYPLYFSDTGNPTSAGNDAIRFLELGGAGLVDLVTGLGDPLAIALDTSNNFVYWTDDNLNHIRRANLDGTNPQTLVNLAGFSQPRAIALDITGGLMYWVDGGLDRIERANLDGSNRQTLVTLTGASNPFATGIALDLSANKMYWTEDGNNKIQSANLDGTGVQDLVTTGLLRPRAITVDLISDKLYWSDLQTQTIERINLDGTNREIVLNNIPMATGLAIADSKLYWADDINNTVQRANLDGTDVETLFVASGVFTPTGLAIAV